jgi:hypothetical protein
MTCFLALEICLNSETASLQEVLGWIHGAAFVPFVVTLRQVYYTGC